VLQTFGFYQYAMSFKILGRLKLDGDELADVGDDSNATTGVGQFFGKVGIS
jgi:hypothetical protein